MAPRKLFGRLPVVLVVAVATCAAALLAVMSLGQTWWPADPTPDDLAELSDGYELIEAESVQCGNGGTHECGWGFVIEHNSGEAALRAELDRIGIDPLRINEVAADQSRVQLSWIVSDPGPAAFVAGIGLLLLAVVSGALAVIALLAILAGVVAAKLTPEQLPSPSSDSLS